MAFGFQISGKVVSVHTDSGNLMRYCTGYLCEGTPDISVTVTPEDIAFERIKAVREDEIEGLPVRQLSDEQLEITALQRKLTEALFDHDTLLFHGSVVAVDGQAYLFTAKSGTGKSTHTRLWREVFGSRAIMVNDDKPFLRVTPDGVVACGSPWMGKHGLGQNISLPLKAICILQRGQENRITPITAQQALPMLFQQSQRPARSENMPKYMDLIDQLAARVDLYKMACNMDSEAARVAFRTMSVDRKDKLL